MKAHSLKVQQCLFVHLQVLVNSVNRLTILSDKAILRLVQPRAILVLCPPCRVRPFLFLFLYPYELHFLPDTTLNLLKTLHLTRTATAWLHSDF